MTEDSELIHRLHLYRQEISKIIKPVRTEAAARPERGGPEITLAWRSLQQAKMWLGLALGENDTNPPWEKDGDN
jgi:hypothetical protein